MKVTASAQKTFKGMQKKQNALMSAIPAGVDVEALTKVLVGK